MKILFLDFDGIVNNSDPNTCIERIPNTIEYFNPDLARHVNNLVINFNFKIVISSAWRRGKTFKQLEYLLSYMNIQVDLVGVTTTDYLESSSNPSLPNNRALQITKWLKETKLKVNDYLILDDSCDVTFNHNGNYFLVDNTVGFNYKHYKDCINFLKYR